MAPLSRWTSSPSKFDLIYLNLHQCSIALFMFLAVQRPYNSCCDGLLFSCKLGAAHRPLYRVVLMAGE